MDRYALFFDLDGTLMENVDHLYPKIEKMLDQLKKNGHLCFVATGRGYSNIPESLKSIMNGFITLTGAGCIMDGKDIIRHTVAKEYVDQFAKLSFSSGAPIYLENDERMDVIASDDFEYEKEVVEMRGFLTETYKTYEEYKKTGIQTAKIDTRIRFKEQIDVLPAVRSGRLITLDAGDGWYEILLSGVDKGTAIRELCGKIGHDIKNTICFGDSGNDLAMFEVCGISIAVSNASDEVKQKATVVLEGDNQEAVIGILREYGLISSLD